MARSSRDTSLFLLIASASIALVWIRLGWPGFDRGGLSSRCGDKNRRGKIEKLFLVNLGWGSSKLAMQLLVKWAWGTMSLPTIQMLAAAAVKDGLSQPLLRWVCVNESEISRVREETLKAAKPSRTPNPRPPIPHPDLACNGAPPQPPDHPHTKITSPNQPPGPSPPNHPTLGSTDKKSKPEADSADWCPRAFAQPHAPRHAQDGETTDRHRGLRGPGNTLDDKKSVRCWFSRDRAKAQIIYIHKHTHTHITHTRYPQDRAPDWPCFCDWFRCSVPPTKDNGNWVGELGDDEVHDFVASPILGGTLRISSSCFRQVHFGRRGGHGGPVLGKSATQTRDEHESGVEAACGSLWPFTGTGWPSQISAGLRPRRWILCVGRLY